MLAAALRNRLAPSSDISECATAVNGVILSAYVPDLLPVQFSVKAVKVERAVC